MNIKFLGLACLLFVVLPSLAVATDITGAGSTIPAPLIHAWGDKYTMRHPDTVIRYVPSTPADGIKRLISNEIDFSTVDMPLSAAELTKNGLIQFPFALGAVTPVVNLPGIYAGQLKLDGRTLGDIFLGSIKKWNDPAIVALNPKLRLPNENIIIIHRTSPPNVKTVLGDYLSKTNPQWKTSRTNGDMSGAWPASSVEVADPAANMKLMKEIKYSIGYGPVQLALKNFLAYVQLKNMSGNFVSPSDENISAAAINAKWDAADGYGVILTDMPGVSSWPMSNASFILLRKEGGNSERGAKFMSYFKYSLRYGNLIASEMDFVPMPFFIN